MDEMIKKALKEILEQGFTITEKKKVGKKVFITVRNGDKKVEYAFNPKTGKAQRVKHPPQKKVAEINHDYGYGFFGDQGWWSE